MDYFIINRRQTVFLRCLVDISFSKYITLFCALNLIKNFFIANRVFTFKFDCLKRIKSNAPGTFIDMGNVRYTCLE